MLHFSPRLRAALVAAACLLTAPATVTAQSDADVFAVSGIPVDATAADAVSARTEALGAGQKAGLERLLRRLVPAEAYPRLPSVDGLFIERYVQNFEITNEQLSTTRYIAKLNVRYDPDAVRDLLQSAGLSFAEVPSVPVVVLPLYQSPAGPRLWSDDNPWWQAWSEHLDPERLLRLVLPLGDLEDITALSAAQVEADDKAAIVAFAERYGSEDALIVEATPLSADEPAAPPALGLAMRRVGQVEQTNPPETLRGRPDQSLEELMAEAVQDLQNSLDERWKGANLLRFDQAGIMVVDVPIARLTEWVTIDQGLRSLPEVSEVEIATFARDNVRAQIRYIGDEFRLEQALARLGLALSREGESWLLQPNGESPSQGEPPSATSTSF